MGAIGYLVFARMRNQILSLKKNPARLIYILVIFALIFVTLLGGNEAQGTPTRDLHELIAGVLALYTLIFLMLVNGGFKNGANMFALSDVNLLFPAPVAPAGVLFYGLFRQIGSSFLLGFFILFQYT